MPNIIDSIRMSGTTYAISDSGGTKVVEITQSDYDNLPTSAKTANIMYVITDAEPFDVSNYYTKAETSGATELATAFAATQPKLSAGTNITIDANNVISAEGGGGKAVVGGRGITVTSGETADTVSFNLPISADTDGSVNKLIIGSGNTIGSDTEKNIIIGDDNTTFGQGGGRYYTGATIIGYNNRVGLVGMQDDANDWSFAIGRRNQINGGNSFIIGTDNNFNRVFGKKINNLSVLGHHNQTSSLQTDERGIGQWVIGAYNEVSKQGETAIGIYNLTKKDGTTSGNTIFTIGNGTANNARHNAFEIRQNGDIYLSLNGQDVKLQDQLGGGGGIDSGTVQTMIDQSISGKTNQTDFVSHSGNSSIHVTTAQTAAWDAKSDFSGSYNDLTDKPTIPTSASQLTNDSGYITSSALNGYATEDYVTAATNDMATKTWVGNQGYLTQHQDISGKLDVSVFESYSGTVNTELSNKLDTTAYTPVVIDSSLNTSSNNAVANSAITNNTLSGGVESNNYFRSVRFRKNNGEVAFYKRFAAINGKSVMVDGTTEAPNFSLVGTSAITTSVTSASTDVQVPSAKAVNDKLGGLSIVKLTQSEYDGLATKDNSTLYVIVN